jgi:hypothetical protein
LHAGVEAPEAVQRLAESEFMAVDYAAAAAQIQPSAEFLAETFTK